jgi:predicted nucleic acid-binding protein
MERLNNIWTLLVDSGHFTDEELKLVTCINGYNEESINDAIHARTGFHDIEQLFSEDLKMLKDYDISFDGEEDEDGEESPESIGQ